MYRSYQKSSDEVLLDLKTGTEGLTTEEATNRLLKYGKNIISTEKKISPIAILLSQFKNLLVVILIISGIITGVIGIIEKNMESIIDVIAIFVVVLLNAFLGFYQEYSAEKAVKALKKLTKSEVIVIRENIKQKISAELLVPGDIIILETGDVISADIRLIQSYEIRVNESILTGESVPVRKKTQKLPKDTTLADRINMLYKGTMIVNGIGMGVVSNTGSTTELGKIATSLQEIKSEDTPIQKKLSKVAMQLTIVVFVLSIIIFVIGIFTLGLENWTTLLIFTIGLAVAAVPEGLPTVLTLSLALGINRLAKKNALIRQLPTVEVLGSATTICTDKTGTLTRNEQTVRLLWTLDGQYEVTGEGYYNYGSIITKSSVEQSDPMKNRTLRKAIEIGALANEASIEKQGENKPYKIFGDPTEVALLILAEKAQTIDKLEKKYSIEYIFPFDSDRKRMSVIVKNKETGKYRIMVKGALDILVDLCTKQFSNNEETDFTEEQRNEAITISERYSSNFSYRILGLAFRDITAEEEEKLILSERYELVEKNLTFVGFVGMIDPPRTQSKPAINKARAAGIKVIMITGDHLETAKAIGRSIGLCMSTKPITGEIIDRMTDDEFDQIVRTTDVYARVNPEHKLRIVSTLKEQGEIVAMTGDGVNDSPALKKADIGIAMGITGTDVSKEASNMILLDDNFSNIIEAVAEGRTIYTNIKKFIGYLLSANAGEIFTVLFGVLFGLIFFRTSIIPILTIQLLYINIVTDTFPALALGVSRAEKDVMLRRPRDPEEPIIDKEMIAMILISGLSYAIGALIVYFWAMNFTLSTDPTDVKTSETMVFISLVIYQLFHSLSVSQERIIFNKDFLKNRKLFLAFAVSFALLIIAIYVPFMNRFVHTVPIGATHWGMIVLTALPILIIDEVRKLFFRKKQIKVNQELDEEMC
jgi:Ca2+-transporting ATPase